MDFETIYQISLMDDLTHGKKIRCDFNELLMFHGVKGLKKDHVKMLENNIELTDLEIQQKYFCFLEDIQHIVLPSNLESFRTTIYTLKYFVLPKTLNDLTIDFKLYFVDKQTNCHTKYIPTTVEQLKQIQHINETIKDCPLLHTIRIVNCVNYKLFNTIKSHHANCTLKFFEFF